MENGEWRVGRELATGKGFFKLNDYVAPKLYSMLQSAHKKLEVYSIARELVKLIYLVTAGFPKDEQFLLTNQLRRAAVSVCSNLAEGSSRISKVEKKRFYEIARASLVEMDTQLEIAVDLGYVKPEQLLTFESKLESVFRMLSKMIQNFS